MAYKSRQVQKSRRVQKQRQVPDGSGGFTVEPEAITIVRHDGRMSWVAVRGQTIRKDGSPGAYREALFGAGGDSQEPAALPSWINEIVEHAGLTWPGPIQDPEA